MGPAYPTVPCTCGAVVSTIGIKSVDGRAVLHCPACTDDVIKEILPLAEDDVVVGVLVFSGYDPETGQTNTPARVGGLWLGLQGWRWAAGRAL